MFDLIVFIYDFKVLYLLGVGFQLFLGLYSLWFLRFCKEVWDLLFILELEFFLEKCFFSLSLWKKVLVFFFIVFLFIFWGVG